MAKHPPFLVQNKIYFFISSMEESLCKSVSMYSLTIHSNANSYLLSCPGGTILYIQHSIYNILLCHPLSGDTTRQGILLGEQKEAKVILIERCVFHETYEWC